MAGAASAPVARIAVARPFLNRCFVPTIRWSLRVPGTLPTAPNTGGLPEVAAAILGRPSGGVAQLVRAPACHAGGRGFESRRSRFRVPSAGRSTLHRQASRVDRPSRRGRDRKAGALAQLWPHGTSITARSVLVAIVGVCLCLMFVSAAAATVTIGPTDLSGNQGSAGGTDATFVQVTQPTAGVFLTVPADGVLTAWHVHGQALNGGTLALRVLRDHADGTFTSVATSDPVEANLSDGSPAHAVSIPVLAGDYIGVAAASPTAASSPSVFVTKPSGATYDAVGPGFAVGSTMSPASASSGRLMLNAVESVRPAVSGVAPSSGPTSGGQAVTITGSNLDGATEVTFGGTPAAGFTASANQITAVAPAHTQGTIDVQVTGPGGVSPATSADAYTFVEPGGTPPSTTPTAANGPIISGVGQ